MAVVEQSLDRLLTLKEPILRAQVGIIADAWRPDVTRSPLNERSDGVLYYQGIKFLFHRNSDIKMELRLWENKVVMRQASTGGETTLEGVTRVRQDISLEGKTSFVFEGTANGTIANLQVSQSGLFTLEPHPL